MLRVWVCIGLARLATKCLIEFQRFLKEMVNYSVYLGALGWSHAQWHGDFYPDNLPGDWQLAFYNTQFRCVFLPYSYWREVADAEISCWLQETREEFRFVLELPPEPDEKTMYMVERFGERGVLERQIDIEWLEGEPDLRGLAKRVQMAASGSPPLFLISRDASLAQLRQVGELMEVLGV